MSGPAMTGAFGRWPRPEARAAGSARRFPARGFLRRMLLAALALVFAGPALGAAAPSPAQRAADAVHALRGIPVRAPESAVPPEARPHIVALRSALRDAVVAAVAADPEGTPAALAARVTADLRRAGLVTGLEARFAAWAPRDVPPIGAVAPVAFERPESDVLVAVTRFSIPCGGDESVLVFRRTPARRWRLAIERAARPYTDSSGARENSTVTVWRPDAKGEPVFVVASSPPACSSCWSALRYEFLREGAAPESARLLHSGHAPAYRCGVPDRLVVPHGERLSIVVEGGAAESDEPGLHSEHVRAFAWSGGAVDAAPPVVVRPDPFVRAWLAAAPPAPDGGEDVRAELAGRAPVLEVVRFARDGEPRWAVEIGRPLARPAYAMLRLDGGAPALESLAAEWPAGLARGTGEPYPEIAETAPVRDPASRVEPVFPEASRRAGIRGPIVLAVVVRADGTVGSIGVVRAPHPRYGLEAAAVEAVRQWRYAPGVTARGAPGAALVRVEFEAPVR